MNPTKGSRVPSDPDRVPDPDVFLKLMQRWADAVASRDPASFEALWAADYSYTSPEGVRLTRSQIMDLEMDVPVPGPMHDIRVQPVVDGVVIVRGGHPLKGEFQSEHVRPDLAEQVSRGVEIAFTSVWRRQEDGEWKVVSNDAHIVRSD